MSAFEWKMPYYRQDVSGVTPEMFHTRNVERKMISVCKVIVRYVIGNPPSKETDKKDKQTSRKFDNSNSCYIIDCRCIWVTGERERDTEAVRQNYDNSELLPMHGALFLAHNPSHICPLRSQLDLLNLGDSLAVGLA